MGTNVDNRFARGNLSGNTTVPRLTLPQIRGTVRRLDPDGSHAQPYWAGLSGTSLVIEVGTMGGGVINTVTVNFTSNFYAAAIAAVNAVAPSDVKWLESDGFACLQDQHSGGKNYMKILSGSAAAIFGVPLYPAPGGFSRAGDFVPAIADETQKNPQTTELLAHDENLTTSNINRAIAGSLQGVDQALADLDREIAVWRTVDFIFDGSSGLVQATSATANLRLNTAAIAQALADGYSYPDIIQILDTSHQAYYRSSPATRVLASGVGYGAGTPSSGAITWGTPSAKSVDTTAAAQSLKQSAQVIGSILGDTLYVPTATFVTNRVQPGDHALISGSNNDFPFNHNGEFVVIDVPDEEHIVLRAMGYVETKVVPANDAPPAVNSILSVGTSYGSLSVYIGWSFPLGGKASTSSDSLHIAVTSSDSAGTHAWVRMPTSMTLREVISNGLIDRASFETDPQIAYKNKTNEFALLNTFDSGISIPTLADLGGGLRNARVQLPITISESTPLDPVVEQTGVNFGANSFSTRVYFQTGTGGITITTNAKYFPGSGNWQKDTTTANSTRVDILPSGITYSMQLSTDASIWADGSWTQIPFKMNIDDLTVDANALVARFVVRAPGGISVDRTLLIETKGTFDEGGGSFIYTRMYVDSLGGGYTITSNARWDGTNWNKDVSGFVASHYFMVAGQFHAETRKSTSNSAWDDSSWDGVPGRLVLDAINASLRLPGQLAFDNVPGEASGIGSVPILSFDGSANSPNLVRFLRASTSSLSHTNIYFTPTGEMYISFGCHWEQALTKWVSDITAGGGGGGQLIKFSENRIAIYAKGTGVANWTDTDPPTSGGWDTKAIDIQDLVSTVNGAVKFGGSLAPATASLTQVQTARLLADIPTTITGDATLELTKLMEWGTSGSMKWRMYVGTSKKEWRLTFNAQWMGDSAGWTADIGSTSSNPAYTYSLGDKLRMTTKTNTTAAWADNAWSDNLVEIDTGANITGNLTVEATTGAAIYGQGGADGSPGVEGVGAGGSTNGPGVLGVGGANDGDGVQGQGTGIGAGVRGTGSVSTDAEAVGILAVAGNRFAPTFRADDGGGSGSFFYTDWMTLPGGRATRYQESWVELAQVSTTNGVDTKPLTPAWTWKCGSGGGSTSISPADPTARVNGPGYRQFSTGAGGPYGNACSTNKLHYFSSESEFVSEFEIQNFVSGSSGLFFGLCDSQLSSMPGNSNLVIGFGARSTDTDWQLIVGNGSTCTYTPTLHPVTNSSFAYFRMEIVGGSTILGTTSLRVWFSGRSNPPDVVTSGFPAQGPMYWNMAEIGSGSGGALSLTMGGVDLAWARVFAANGFY